MTNCRELNSRFWFFYCGWNMCQFCSVMLMYAVSQPFSASQSVSCHLLLFLFFLFGISFVNGAKLNCKSYRMDIQWNTMGLDWLVMFLHCLLYQCDQLSGWLFAKALQHTLCNENPFLLFRKLFSYCCSGASLISLVWYLMFASLTLLYGKPKPKNCLVGSTAVHFVQVLN